MEPAFDLAIALGGSALPGRDDALAGIDVLSERAFANFRRAADGEPLDPDYVYILGTALADRGRHAEAAAAFQDAIALDRSQAAYVVALGIARWHLGRYDDAANAFEEALVLAPGDAAALNGLGVARLGQGRAAEASIVLDRASAASPDAWEPVVNAAIARWRSGERTGALAALRRAAVRWPDAVPVLRPLARALAAQGETVEALAQFERVARLAPSDPAAQLDRGDALHRLGRPDDAEAAYEDAQRLDPRAVVGRPESHDARRVIALGRLRAELATTPSFATLLVRAFWRAAGSFGHGLRYARVRGWRSALSLRGLVWTLPLAAACWVGAVVAPVYVRHHLLADDLRDIARTPLDDDAFIRQRLREAVEARGLTAHIPDGCFSLTNEPRLRTISCRYAVPVAIVPGLPQQLRFHLRARELVLAQPATVHY
ncbi:MAG: tetratricopeptide repeat protein [Vicinamibacteria bacterium]